MCNRVRLSKYVARLMAATVIAAFGLAFGHNVAVAGEPHYYEQVKACEAKEITCDVAVYGGTPAGVTAAIQAAKEGKTAVLLSFNRHVGGMTSGGLTATDLGRKDSIGGLALEFYQRIGKARDYRPSDAEALYRRMLDEAGVKVLLTRALESVQMQQNRIVSVKMETGETVRAAMFVDSTYEGDLLAAANVSYRVGREPAAAYDESLGGQWQTVSWKNVYQFCRLPLSPYVVPDDPTSGLLPEISAEAPGKPGEGDYKVQSYNFRMQLSQGEDRIKFPRPPEYDPNRYTLLARFLNLDERIEWRLNYTTAPLTDGPIQMRQGDSNNAGSFSSDYVGGNYRWPDGTYVPGSFTELPPPRRGLTMPFGELYELREQIFQDHVRYQQGLMYFLANDPRVPEPLRARVNAWGLDPQEFQETGYWPHQLYVREGRRMVSDYVVTQADCESRRVVGDSVGLASYPMDSHFCQRVVVEEDGVQTVRNEGGFGHGFRQPYPVSYRSIVPRQSECENLLVPVCLSSSHVAYGSIRMEPVFMILGQSAGSAAVIAIDKSIAVQDVDYKELKTTLERDGQRLTWEAKTVGTPAKPLPGLVTDDTAAQTTGSWTSGALSAVVGLTYLHDGNDGKGGKSATFKISVPKPGTYEVRLLYVPSGNRSTKTPVTVALGDEEKQIIIDQRKASAGGSSLGKFRLTDSVTVAVSNRDTDGFVVIDGVQLLQQQ
ncbi:FAD-dependent oxidoreductase [Fuerstiella marisgermanici]|uniref:Xanthan lyase n=1 Tax=Fuerstiella marisgermanici TaxID=1891926 RepID=A0A1P8WNS7_9PLAN|nr:FAD-dependent oxidoreductase [Fuerstiella marisgermanici]APZ95712.1 Xanthan lyase precursor [Fuerstiella marisgermanici]